MSFLQISLFLCLFGQDPTFRSTTAVVRIDAEVVLPSGQVVSGLAASDFRVLDQGVARTIENFSFEEDPLDLILLFDTSAEMRAKLQAIVRAAELGFHELRAGDRVSVMAYSSVTRVAQAFTGDLEAANDAILLRVLAAPFSGSAHIETAAADAALRFRTEPPSHRKRAILAITDKAEGGAAADIRGLWDGNIVFSELVVGKGGATKVLESAPGSAATRTGGIVIAAGVPGEAFQQSVHYLRTGYTLYYALPGSVPSGEHSFRVELTPEAARRYAGARVRARTGYIVPGR